LLEHEWLKVQLDERSADSGALASSALEEKKVLYVESSDNLTAFRLTASQSDDDYVY